MTTTTPHPDADAIHELRAELASACHRKPVTKSKTYYGSNRTANGAWVDTETTVWGCYDVGAEWLGDGPPPEELTDIEVETDIGSMVMAVATLAKRDGNNVIYEVNCEED